jgi:hypothetical protein
MGRAAAAFILCLVTISYARGQTQQANVNSNGLIATIDAGGSFGQGAHSAVGADLAAPVSKYAMPFLDFTYSPLGSYGYTYGLNDTGKGLYTSAMISVNGGLQIRFPNSSFWVPYIGLGGGLLRRTQTNNMSGFNSTETIHSNRNEADALVTAGTLYYITEHVGLSIGIKGMLASHDRFAEATAGLFFQIP